MPWPHRHLLASRTTDHSHFISRLHLFVRWLPRQPSPEREPLVPISSPNSSTSPPSQPSLTDTYGRCIDLLHCGIPNFVRLHAKNPVGSSLKQLYVVKVFRHCFHRTLLQCHRRQSSIASSLHHPNALGAIDVLRDDEGDLCLVMDFCVGGDLRALATSRQLDSIEADCFFKQTLRALIPT